ncbi:MAG: TRAP-type C4-dicarboxylate transport system permease small subunit [Paraglaciecola sp.]
MALTVTNLVENYSRFVKALSRLKLALAGIFLILMMLHVGADIFMKLAFNSPIPGTLETVSYYYMVGVVFLPLAFVEVRNEHVSVDLFFLMMPNSFKVPVYIFGCIISVAYYGLFCYQTTIDALKATRDHETVMANFLFYVWPSRWALSLGSACLMLAIILNAVNTIVTGVIPESDSDPESI